MPYKTMGTGFMYLMACNPPQSYKTMGLPLVHPDSLWRTASAMGLVHPDSLWKDSLSYGVGQFRLDLFEVQHRLAMAVVWVGCCMRIT